MAYIVVSIVFSIIPIYINLLYRNCHFIFHYPTTNPIYYIAISMLFSVILGFGVPSRAQECWSKEPCIHAPGTLLLGWSAA